MMREIMVIQAGNARIAHRRTKPLRFFLGVGNIIRNWALLGVNMGRGV